MKDSYLNFTNTEFGRKLTSILGLPQPITLRRYANDKTVLDGLVLLGCLKNRNPSPALGQCFENMKLPILTHSLTPENSDKTWSGEKVSALVFDATELDNSASSVKLYQFFKDTIRSVNSHGRVILIGRPPAHCLTSAKKVAQRALEGLSRSLAKELKNGITVQLIYQELGAENQLESALRFLLSSKSAYISGQTIRLNKSNSKLPSNFSWSKPLTGKKVLVTGASRGIGAAISEVMVRDGAELICLDIPQAREALTTLAKRLNSRVIEMDLASVDAAANLKKAAAEDGGWDVIVHNAGITRDKTIANMNPEFWSSVVDINLSCQERINDALVSSGGINAGGRIVCVSSISGIAGNRGQTNYAFSKAGVIGMVESLAPTLADQDITINAVAPGFIETEMTTSMPFGIRIAGRRLNSMSQGGLPVDVAETIAWLASPASSGITANVVRVCGQSILGA